MAETRARDLAKSLGQAVKTDNIAADGSLAVLGVTAYDSSGLLPTSYDSNNAGSLGFAKDSDRLYVHTGQGWFNIAIVNTTPIFDGSGNTIVPNASYDLASDATAYKNGTATVVTIQARDSEGFPITYAATGNTAFNNIAHVEKDSAAGFIFTIEPKSEDSVGEATPAAGTLTFTATDGINIATAASTFNLVFDTTVANSESTVLLMRGVGDSTTKNASFDDVSDANNTITVSGTPYQGTFSPYQSGGYSMRLDGTGDYLTVPSSADFNMGSGNFTIECWVYPTTISTQAIIDQRSTDSEAVPLIWLHTDGYFYYYVSGSNRITGTSGSVKANQWYHVAITRTGSSTKMFVNGIQDGSTYSDSTTYIQGSTLHIGKRYASTAYNFTGFISDFRIVKGTAVYTANFTPPTAPLTAISGTELLISAKSMLRDGSSDNHLVQVSGNPEMRPFTPYKHQIYNASTYGGSVFMDGTDYLTTSGTANTNTGAGQAWTVEYWVYPQTFDTNGNTMFDFRANGSGAGITAEFTSAGNIYMNSGNSPYISDQDYGIVPKNWYHMAFVHTGSVLKFYLNGIEKYSNTHSSLANDNTSGVFGIGYKSDISKHFKGYISDFRFVVGKAVYTGAFSPPTGPLTKTGGTYPNNTNRTDPIASETKYLANFTNGDIIDLSGTSNFGFSAASNAQSDTGNQKYSVPSVLFDGSGDVINIEPFGQPFLFPGDFTIECWAYAVSGNLNLQNSRYRTFFFVGINSQFQFAIDGSGKPLLWDNNNALVTSSTALTGNTWQHIAVSRSGAELVIFLDGVEKGRISDATSEMGGAGSLARIGSYDGSSGALNGAISDLRITKDVSRYPFLPLKETLTTSTSFQNGITIGNSGANTKLLTAHASTFTDGSANNYTITNNGAAIDNFAPGSGMKSIYFTDGDYVDVAASSAIGAIGTGDFTVEMWVYGTGNALDGSKNRRLFMFDGPAGNTEYNLQLIISEQGNTSGTTVGSIMFYGGTGNSGNTGYLLKRDSNVNIMDNNWHHVAVTRESGTLKLFIDGTLETAQSVSYAHNLTTNAMNSGSPRVRIGSYDASSGGLTGYISNFRFVVGQAIYDKDFTPPSLALTG
jgi:hypothetical protein